MKIFISGIDSQLGYHLTESLRQDHLLLEGYSLISGTLTTSQNLYMLHESVHKTFDFSKQRDLTVKDAVDSDVLILDLRNDPAPEIEFILKVLKHYNLKKPIKVIGISNHTTWSNSKTTEFTSVPQDKQLLLEYSLNKQRWQPSHQNRAHYPLRVPHPMFVYNYLLEEQILQLKNSNELIQPIILCTGVVYGRSGFDLRTEIEQAVKGQTSWILNLRNEKQIGQEAVLPFLHMDKLLGEIESIVYGNDGQKDGNPKRQEYNVLCEDEPKSIVKLVQTINEIFGNMKQIHEQKQENINEEKPSTQASKLPSPTNELVPPTNKLINQLPTRKDVNSSSVRISTSQSTVIQSQSGSFIPELTFAKDKHKFSLMMNVNFSLKKQQDRQKENQTGKSENLDDTLVGEVKESDGIDDSQVKVKDHIQKDLQVERKWIQSIVEEFTQYYECEFRQFLLSEELLKTLAQDQQTGDKMIQNILNRYFVINDKVLTQELNILVSNGTIPQERLATPQDEKKKPNSKNQPNKDLVKQQPYEIVFPQVIKHILEKKKHSHFVICLKNELIVKMLSLLNETEVEALNSIKFLNLISKDSNSNSTSGPLSEKISRSIEILSDQIFSIFSIENPTIQNLSNLEDQPDHEEPIKTAQKSRRILNAPKNTADEPQEHKINLMSQYLLDNLIVYLAEAKQQLKMKGKLNLGQKFEGKQNIKLFIEELKNIRERQIKFACEEEEE